MKRKRHPLHWVTLAVSTIALGLSVAATVAALQGNPSPTLNTFASVGAVAVLLCLVGLARLPRQ